MANGVVKTLVIERGFGFIAEAGGPDLFFHMTDLPPELPFAESLQERRVEFTVQQTARGARAIGIVPARD